MDKEIYIKQLIEILTDSDFTTDDIEYMTKFISKHFETIARNERRDKLQSVIDNI